MKTIQLTANENFDERAQLLLLLIHAPADGYTFEEVRALNRIIDKTEAAEDGKIELEDAEWGTLKSRIDRARWKQAMVEIEAFVDKINRAA